MTEPKLQKRRLCKISITGLLMLVPALIFAQTETYELGGYVKYLYGNSDLPTAGRVNDHIFHTRINSKLFFSEWIHLVAELRNRVIYRESVEKTPNFLSTIKAKNDFWNPDIVWWNSTSSVGYSELDRFWVDITQKRFQLTAGRQRIAWGSALVWNPADLFNPLSILDFDYEERPGVDAVRLQYFRSEVSKVELAIKPGKTSSSSIVAAKVLLNRWNYDFHFLGGMQGEDPFVGAAWSGDIKGAGFRGEIASKKVSHETTKTFPFLNDSWSTTFVLSGDYMFRNNTYLHTELLFNNRGVRNNTIHSLPLAKSLGLLSPARWSIFQELSFDLHPLVRTSGFVIYNPDDHSSALVSSVSWSAWENFDVSFFGLFFSGNQQTEYGNYGRSVFLRGKYSF